MDSSEAGPSGITKPQSPPNVSPSPKKKRPKQSALSASEKQVVLNIYKMVSEMWPKDQFPSKVEMVYYTSRYRGICMGHLVSRTAVLSAAVCVTDPLSAEPDRRPVTVVVGAWYRHPRRGVRVPITHRITPKMPGDNLPLRASLLEKSPALLLLKQRVPDYIVEVPLRALAVDWAGDARLELQEECFFAGWHFFYQGDEVFPISKFLLERTVRVQFVNIVKMHEWCDALAVKLESALANVGYKAAFDKTGLICVKDPDHTAQACHGMYGTPLVCGGRAVGQLSAPDAQWTNCTGFSNIVHLYSNAFLRDYMTCVSKMFSPDFKPDQTFDWAAMKQELYQEPGSNEYDYFPLLYDKMLGDSEEERD